MLSSISKWFRNRLSNEIVRRDWVAEQLAALPAGTLILDAGCGSQQYRVFCDHLKYRAQDFGQYVTDVTDGFAAGLGGEDGYKYGSLDYIGDIWDIPVEDSTFSAVLCTEVFEHIPYPTETIFEFARILKPGGCLILTIPSNCLRHMDPYFFYSGFSNRYIDKFLNDAGFEIEIMNTVGDYYSWMAAELGRTIYNHGVISKLMLAPALFWFMIRKKTVASRNSLCMGYHVVARKR